MPAKRFLDHAARETLRRDQFDAKFELLQDQIAEFRVTCSELAHELGDAEATSPDGRSVRQLLERGADVSALAKRIRLTVSWVDRAWTNFLTARVNRGQPLPGDRYKSIADCPWTEIPADLERIVGEIESRLGAVFRAAMQCLRATALDEVSSPEQRLRDALGELSQVGGREQAESYAQLRVGALSTELEKAVLAWRSRWDPLLSAEISLPPELVDAPAVLDGLAATTSELVAFARALRAAIAPAGAYAHDDRDRPLVNPPRPRPLIELYPAGWDEPVPAPPPGHASDLSWRAI